MKNDYEMYQSVLSKRNEHREKKERQKRIIIRTVPVFACFVLTAGLGLGYWNYSKNIPNIPSYPDIGEEVTTSSEVTTSLSTHINSAATISSTKTFITTTAHTTEKSTTSVTETSTSTESTETTVADMTETAAVTETEPPTQNTTVTVTMTTQSSVSTTVTTHDDSHNSSYTTTTSDGHNMGGDYPKVIINGVAYYGGSVDDSDGNEYTIDEFLGYGTDFEGVFHDNPTIKYYTVFENENIVIAVTEIGAQIPFYKLQ